MTHRSDLPLAIELIDKNDYNNSFEFVREILIKTKAFFFAIAFGTVSFQRLRID